MKIALAVDGTRGDVFPMLALAERFRSAGHDPILCAPPDFQPACEERGLELRPFGIDVREFLTREARALAGGALGFAAAIGVAVDMHVNGIIEKTRADFAALTEQPHDARAAAG